MIQLRSVTKKYKNNYALKNINLDIMSGEFVFVTGASGAGKSTLMKLLYKEETPTSGTVLIGGINIANLPSDKVPNLRRCMGIVFQDYKLLPNRTVYENVAFALEIAGMSKKEISKTVPKVLELVNLADKGKKFPRNLSGGERQRVAIARSLANDPDILLCDEATSALDPQTTTSILDLIKEINKELSITVVVITHQMSVVTDLCKKVAIIDSGRLVEVGDVIDIFENPKSDAARELLSEKKIRYSPVDHLDGARRIRIVFRENSSYEPVIANVILKTQIPVNILKADTRNVAGKAVGEMILGLPEDVGAQNEIIQYLIDAGLLVEEAFENE